MPCPIDQLQAQNIKQGQAYYTLTLQVEGGAFKAPLNKNGNFSTFLGPIEPKKFDFSCKPMRMPIIAFWGLEMVIKGVSIEFLLSAVTIS